MLAGFTRQSARALGALRGCGTTSDVAQHHAFEARATGSLPTRVNRRRALLALAAGVTLAVVSPLAQAASPNQATSSRAAREDAVRSIPFDKLDAAMRKKVESTLASTSLYRRLPVQVTPCDPDMYLFLVRHPEVVVNIWEVMNISNVALQRTGPDTFKATDNAGTLCQVKYAYSDHETQVIYAEGSYNGPLFARPLQARCVLLLKSGYIQDTDGRYFVTSRMDTFIDIEHAGVELVAKTLQMLVHRSADYNFIETAHFLSTVSRTAESNPQGMLRLSRKLTNVDEETRGRFAEISLEIGEKARRRGIPASAQLPAESEPAGTARR